MKRHLKGLVKRGLGQAAEARNHPIEKIMLGSVGLVRQPTDTQVDDLATTVASAAAPLLGIALSGNVHAIRNVTELASQLAAEATTLACMHQEAADAVARERTTWPLNVSHDPAERRRTLRLVTGPRRLPLGEKARPRPAARKPYSLSSPAHAALLVAMKAIEIERSFRVPSELFPVLQPEWSSAAAQLPPLDTATAERWFDVIWMYVCQRHGGAPERSALQRVVDPAAGPNGGTDAAARAAIRHALREAFSKLVRKATRKKETKSKNE